MIKEWEDTSQNIKEYDNDIIYVKITLKSMTQVKQLTEMQ